MSEYMRVSEFVVYSIFNRLHVRILYAAIFARRTEKKLFTNTRNRHNAHTHRVCKLARMFAAHDPRIEEVKQSHAMTTWTYLGWTVNATPCCWTPTSALSAWTPLKTTVTHESHTIKLCISFTLLFFRAKVAFDLAVFVPRLPKFEYSFYFWTKRWKEMMSPNVQKRLKEKKHSKCLTLWI